MNEMEPYRHTEVIHVEACESCANALARRQARWAAWDKTGWPLTKYSLARMPIIAAAIGMIAELAPGHAMSGWGALAVCYAAVVGLRVGYKVLTTICPTTTDDWGIEERLGEP